VYSDTEEDMALAGRLPDLAARLLRPVRDDIGRGEGGGGGEREWRDQTMRRKKMLECGKP
jgi:hypothetical protein